MGVEHVFVEYDPSHTNQFDLGFRKHVYAIELSHFEIAGMTTGTGAQGPQGPQGPAGAQGATGATGAAGAAGAPGAPGEPGEPGSPGGRGADGADGAAGPAGPAGPFIWADLKASQGIVHTESATVIPNWQAPQGHSATLSYLDTHGVTRTLWITLVGQPFDVPNLFNTANHNEQFKNITLRVQHGSNYVEDTVGILYVYVYVPPIVSLQRWANGAVSTVLEETQNAQIELKPTFSFGPAHLTYQDQTMGVFLPLTYRLSSDGFYSHHSTDPNSNDFRALVSGQLIEVFLAHTGATFVRLTVDSVSATLTFDILVDNGG